MCLDNHQPHKNTGRRFTKIGTRNSRDRHNRQHSNNLTGPETQTSTWRQPSQEYVLVDHVALNYAVRTSLCTHINVQRDSEWTNKTLLLKAEGGSINWCLLLRGQFTMILHDSRQNSMLFIINWSMKKIRWKQKHDGWNKVI